MNAAEPVGCRAVEDRRATRKRLPHHTAGRGLLKVRLVRVSREPDEEDCGRLQVTFHGGGMRRPMCPGRGAATQRTGDAA